MILNVDNKSKKFKQRGPYRRYESAFKRRIVSEKDFETARVLGIPSSTISSWLQQYPSTQNGDLLSDSVSERETLKGKIRRTQDQLEIERAKTKILRSFLKFSQMELKHQRVGGRQSKIRLLRLVDSERHTLSISDSLKLIGLSKSRYQSWKKKELNCSLNDLSHCPKSFPNQLTFEELNIMKQYYDSEKYAHFPLRSLQLRAKRDQKLFCSLSTWQNTINRLKWSKRRLYVAKKKQIGIRAKRPNEIWHIDVSQVTLSNGEKGFIQVILDNYSRLILAYQVSKSWGGILTSKLINEASKKLAPEPKADCKIILSDSGKENVNRRVSELCAKQNRTHLLAGVDVRFSNSMVEAFFRSLKHNHLLKKRIICISDLKRELEFYVQEHNNQIPHSAFNGETPAEVFYNKFNRKDKQKLDQAGKSAQIFRREKNKVVACKLHRLMKHEISK